MCSTRRRYSWRDLDISHGDPETFDYPLTSMFIPTTPTHFRQQRSAREVRNIVIHITGGHNISSAVHGFRGSRVASIHYIVDRDGSVIQMVREQDIAFHAGGNRINGASIGVEHVNAWNGESHETPTQIQYESSARLVKYLCLKYDIPIQHDINGNGIWGHCEANPETTHAACPNAAWDWNLYCRLVNQASVIESFNDMIESLTHLNTTSP